MSEFSNLIQRLVNNGVEPQELQDEFRKAVLATELWIYWGSSWRPYLVCSKCGSGFAGVCHDDGTAEPLYSGDPGFHKNQPGVTRIPYKEWKGNMTEKLPGVGPDGVLTIGALKELLKDTHGYPTLGDLRLVQAQHGVDLAHEASAVAAAVKAERERVLEEVRKAVESTTRLSLVGFQPEDYNHPAFRAGAKSQMKAILEKLADIDEENYGIIKDKD